jgi:hypothetical protein
MQGYVRVSPAGSSLPISFSLGKQGAPATEEAKK